MAKQKKEVLKVENVGMKFNLSQEKVDRKSVV